MIIIKNIDIGRFFYYSLFGGDKMNTRIRELRKNLKLSQRDFGKRLGVKDNAISRIESGERNLTDQMFLSICREFSINEHWLRTGEGEMYIQTDDSLFAKLSKEYNLSSGMQELLRAVLDLDETRREQLIGFISYFNSRLTHDETAATIAPVKKNTKGRITTDEEIEEELTSYRTELIAEQKGQSALQNLGEEKKA